MAIPLTKTKSAIPDEEMADFVYVSNLVSNDDLDTCVLDFLAQSVRNAGIGNDDVCRLLYDFTLFGHAYDLVPVATQSDAFV